jgi:hypothetical protein
VHPADSTASPFGYAAPSAEEEAYPTLDEGAEAYPVEEIGGSPWYKKWWVWTVVGAAVVGAGVTAGVLLSGEEEAGKSGFTASVNWPAVGGAAPRTPAPGTQ